MTDNAKRYLPIDFHKAASAYFASSRAPSAPRLSDVAKAIMVNHASAHVRAGGPIKRRYDEAIHELYSVNQGASAVYPAPVTPYAFFSYATFRRCCADLGQHPAVVRRDPDQVNHKARVKGRKRSPSKKVLGEPFLA